MGWSHGYDPVHDRDIGYGIEAKCDHPDCEEMIDRGLSYVCGSDIYGGNHGCGLYFCEKHRHYTEVCEADGEKWSPELCERCRNHDTPFDPKP